MSNQSMEVKVKELLELKRMKEELEAEIAAVEDEIKAVMGEEETLFAGAFKVSWKTFERSKFRGKPSLLPVWTARHSKRLCRRSPHSSRSRPRPADFP